MENIPTKERCAILLWKIGVGLTLILLLVIVLFRRLDKETKRLAEQTCQELRQQGFKIDLSEFNFSTATEFRTREAALTFEEYAVNPERDENLPELMKSVDCDSAIVVWKNKWVPTGAGATNWEVLTAILAERERKLDDACDAVLAGPIRLNLEASQGLAISLRSLGTLKNLDHLLASRTVVRLHNGNIDAAWTNLLACTRLVTAWEPDAVDICHLVRFACVSFSFEATWQALQTNAWNDKQLAILQNEWEDTDFFKRLPESAAFQRAASVDLCRRYRQQPQTRKLSGVFNTVLHDPKYAGKATEDYWSTLRYPLNGTFVDERDLLLHYRDRELELRRAVQATNWVDMQALPGVTNFVAFTSAFSTPLQVRLNLAAITRALHSQGAPMLARAAEAETRRRILITAIALERYHRLHGAYPAFLQELAPNFVKNLPIDFMDGKPLHYHPTDDNHYVLYSVGLDCVDNGGQLRVDDASTGTNPGLGIGPGCDLVWPRPASDADAEAKRLDGPL